MHRVVLPLASSLGQSPPAPPAGEPPVASLTLVVAWIVIVTGCLLPWHERSTLVHIGTVSAFPIWHTSSLIKLLCLAFYHKHKFKCSNCSAAAPGAYVSTEMKCGHIGQLNHSGRA